MKKIVFLVSLAFVALSVAAQDITGASIIKLGTSGKSDKELRFILSDEFSDSPNDQMWDAESGNAGGLYVFYGGKRYSTWASNGYSKNLALGFGAGSNNTYFLKFVNNKFQGPSYEIYDVVVDTTIVVNGTNSDYKFTITDEEKGHVINNRFLINYEFTPDEGELNICFNEKGTNTLEIKNNPYTGKIAIKNAAGEDVLRSPYQPLKTPQEIDLSSLPAGRYTVILTKDEEEKKLIIVK